MGAIRSGLMELECCPQCAGRVLEALDAAGVSCDSGCLADCEGADCGCAEACACLQPNSCSSTPSG